MTKIHPTAIVDKKAEIDSSVEIGPFCHIGPHVKLAANVVLKSHVVIDCHATIGEGTIIYPFASLQPPQDLKYKGEPSELIVGKNNNIREYVTINTGTEGGGMKTVIGDHCLLMIGSHVAHDCVVGNHVVMANNATLAGHVSVGDFAVLGGLCAVRQFVRIGSHVMVGGMTGVEQDVIPYGLVMGNRARLTGLNIIGLRRHGLEKSSLQGLRQAYNVLFERESAIFAQRIQEVEAELGDNDLVRVVLDFIKTDSKLGLCQPATSKEVRIDDAA